MPKTTYTFGPFSIDADSRLLFRNAERVPLPPKAADILVALVEREGQLVTKDELLKEVWPDTFVEEANLAVNMTRLRQVLSDDTGQTYVETVPKRGYRFVAPVRTITEEPAPSLDITTPAPLVQPVAPITPAPVPPKS